LANASSSTASTAASKRAMIVILEHLKYAAEL
jgi:hypothetical protein